jgi:DNA repair protein RecO
MEQTYNTRAIILNRLDFREHDSRIICYSADRGKLELVARGAKKLKSKSSGHLEPLTLTRLMVVAGKDYNYAGTATGENFYSNIKSDLDKIFTASEAVKLVEKMTRVGEVDNHAEIFNLLKDFLDELEKKSPPWRGGASLTRRPALSPAEGGGFGEAACFEQGQGVRVMDGNSIEVFSKKLSAILGFSQEDFEELNKNNIQ